MSISTGTTNASIQKTIACSYLADLEPDLFETVPRPGGILNIELPPPTVEPCCNLDDDEFFEDEGEDEDTATIASGKSSKRSTLASITGGGSKRSTPGKKNLELAFLRSTREYRLNKVMRTCPWSYADAYQSKTSVDAPGSFQGAIDFLAVSISTIMLMAVDYKDIPQKHFEWTSKYLECIKEDTGHNPPNVKGILNHIKFIYDEAMADKMAADITKSSNEGDEATQVEIQTSNKLTDAKDKGSNASIRTTTSIKSKSSSKGSKLFSKISSKTKARTSASQESDTAGETAIPPIPEEKEEGDNITIASSRRSTLTSMTGGGSKKSVSRTPLELAFERTTRPVRIDKVMNTCPWSYADANQTSEISIDVPGSFQDSIDLLAISISTIMLMAANYKDIPSRHFDWTSSYLECIKDDYGHHPPNIKGILNQIKLDYDNVMADRVAAEIAKAADGDAATQVEVETSDRPTETEPQESEALKPSSSITSKSSTKGSKSKILSQTKVRGSKTSTTEPPIPEDG